MLEKDAIKINNFLNEIVKQDKENYDNIEKLTKSNKELYEQYLKYLEENKDLTRTIDAYILKIKQINVEFEKLKKEVDDLNDENSILLRENDELKREKNRLREQLENPIVRNEPQKTQESQKNNNYKIILSAFNAWAAKPGMQLPRDFSYIEGEISIRTKQDIVFTQNRTKWIATRDKNYLFPNPNSLNDRSDISELYHGEIANIKPKDNRIEVLEPCEMSETGFIEFPGKFKLLN